MQSISPGASHSEDHLIKTHHPHSTNITRITSTGARNTFALTQNGELFQLFRGSYKKGWQRFLATEGSLYQDVAVSKKWLGNYLFAIGKHDKLLYRFSKPNNSMELISPDLETKIISIAPKSKHRVYAVTESGDVMYINFDKRKLWTKIGEGMKKVVTGSGEGKREVWAIGIDSHPYRFNYGKKTWIKFDVLINDLTVGRDNSILGTTQEGNLVKFDGKSTFVNIIGTSRFTYVEANTIRDIFAIDKNGVVIEIALQQSMCCPWFS